MQGLSDSQSGTCPGFRGSGLQVSHSPIEVLSNPPGANGLRWETSFGMSCRLPGELGRGGHAAAGTCNLYAELFGIKESKGAREPRAPTKEWVVQVDRGVKRGG